MKHTVIFTGTDTEKLEQAWAEIKAYLGARTAKLAMVREEYKTVGNEKRAEHAAQMIGVFWGIEGYYPVKAVEEFLFGAREI